MQKSSQSTSSNVVLNPAQHDGAATCENPQTAVFPGGKQGWVGGIPSDQTVLKGHQKDALKLILVILAVTVNDQETREIRGSGLDGWRMIVVSELECTKFT